MSASTGPQISFLRFGGSFDFRGIENGRWVTSERTMIEQRINFSSWRLENLMLCIARAWVAYIFWGYSWPSIWKRWRPGVRLLHYLFQQRGQSRVLRRKNAGAGKAFAHWMVSVAFDHYLGDKNVPRSPLQLALHLVIGYSRPVQVIFKSILEWSF